MSVSAVGNSVTGRYLEAYSSQSGMIHTKSEEIKNSEKAYGAARTYQRADFDTTYAQQTYKSSVLLDKDMNTTFPMPSSVCRLVQYTKVINEHYAKVNEENKKFDNPEKHIWDKYHNPKSPYFVKGLTNKEREICQEAETRVLYGLPAPVNSYDPIIQKTFGGGIMDEKEWNDEVRSNINDSINQLFEENGIIIPEGVDLRLKVDPYEYKIIASGVDEVLAEKIEEVLNRGNNGKYLYGHLRQCNPAGNGFEQPKQYLYDIAYQEKVVMWHFVNDMTALDMRKLENKDGVIYTPDGQNLWDMVTEQYNEKLKKGEIDSLPISSLYKTYQIYVKEGWDKEDERGLTIGYKDGSLYDLDTDYGYGPSQREWLDKAKEKHQQFWENYRKEREETLRTEKDIPVGYDKWQAELARTEEIMSTLSNNTYSKTGALLTQPDLKAMQLLFDHAVKNGRVIPLTKEILHLSSKVAATHGFDSRT